MSWLARVLLLSLTAVVSLKNVYAGPSSASSEVRNVAIIGAGAAGSSTAYYLRRYADEHDLAVNITVFEKTDRIGGRTLTIDPYGISVSDKAVELGASIFVQINHILYNATREFGLDTTDHEEDGVGGVMAFWDGDQIVFDINSAHSEWRTKARMIWRWGYYGLRDTQALMQRVVNKFLNLYEPPYFPFESLTRRTYELGLLEETSVTGEELLRKNKIPQRLSHEFVQALTRVNYASNLAHLHGLETMVAIAAEGAMAVVGGNWRIFDRMVAASGAAFLPNTSVSAIDVKTDSTVSTSKYLIRTQSTSTDDDAATEQTQDVVFDDVVVATPFQFSKISTSNDILENTIDEIPYITLHVTIFTSPFRLSMAYFHVSSASKVPTTVLTTLAETDDPLSGVQGVGKAGFYSISTLRMIVNPKTGRKEYLYKIFSAEPLTPGFLSDLFGVKVPDTFTGYTPQTDASAEAVEPISWYYPHVFHSYPKGFPRVTFQDPVIAPGLYYTSAMESFISTMETNALMGRNVARLIVDDMLAADKAKTSVVGSVLANDGQRVLEDL